MCSCLMKPTNHLDIPSREVLEEALAEYPATIFMISHDRYFLNKLVNKLLVFENGTAKLFFGTYAEYEAHVREQKRVAMQVKEEAEKAKKSRETGKKQRRERLRVASTSKKSKKETASKSTTRG